MTYRYTLSENLVAKVAMMIEFANGGTQVSVRLRDGRIFGGILISSCKHPIAMRGFDGLPFAIEDIEDVFQTKEDQSPSDKSPWMYWDIWK